MKEMERILGRRLRLLKIAAVVSGAVLVLGIVLPYGLANLILTAAGLLALIPVLIRYVKVKWRGLFTMGNYRGDIAGELESGCTVIEPGYYFLKLALLDSVRIQTAHYEDIISVKACSDSGTLPGNKRRRRIIVTGPAASITLTRFGGKNISAEESFNEVCRLLRERAPQAGFTEER